MSYISHLECAQCKQVYSAITIQTFCHECHAPILTRYNLDDAKKSLDRDIYLQRPSGMWRWQELLPVNDVTCITSLGEGDTPLIPLQDLGADLGITNLMAKEESLNPTASFKARGLSAAVSKARELGLRQLVIPTAGNAGGALAAYASRARMKSTTVMPKDTPASIITENRLLGADVILVDGLISDCAQVVNKMTSSGDWFSLSTFREPYRLEGKKIMGYELAEAYSWRLPDVIIYPTGGGTGLVGMWKAFQELFALGWLEVDHFPRMISVQAEGCAPVTKAFEAGAEKCDFWSNAETIASGLRVPLSLADQMILKILRESGGTAIAVSDEAMINAQCQLARREGIFASPEGAATLAALYQLIASGSIQKEESVVLFITASGVKYI